MKRVIVLLAALATALAISIPVAGAADDAHELASAQKTVQQGKYDSYIVVMKADPLVATEGKDNLDTPKARQRGNGLKR